MHCLRFHKETERWRAYDGGKLLYPLHCGDAMLFQVGETFIPTNIELDTEWVVRFGETKFWLHRKTEYRVMMLS
jgi:hypothetical protein